jgi:hypothetical protein
MTQKVVLDPSKGVEAAAFQDLFRQNYRSRLQPVHPILVSNCSIATSTSKLCSELGLHHRTDMDKGISKYVAF